MTLIERLAQRYSEARGKATSLLERYHEQMDAGETDEAAETLRKQERAFADAQRIHGELETARAANDLPDIEVVRSDRGLPPNPSGGISPRSGGDLSEIPSPMDLLDRHQLMMRALSSMSRTQNDDGTTRTLGLFADQLTDDEVGRATRVYAVERLFVKRIAELCEVGDMQMTADERKAWAQYQASAKAFERGDFQSRAFTNVLNLGTNQGAEVIPTILQAQIWPRVFMQGPLADDNLVYVIRLPWEAKTDVALLGGAPKATVVAPGANATPGQPRTAKVNFDPNKYTLMTAMASELITGGGFTDIERRLVDWLAEGFGVAFNEDGTVGDGSNKMKGFLGDAATVTAASGTTFTADEVRSTIIGLGDHWIGRPNVRAMCTLAVENRIAQMRVTSGTGGTASTDGREFMVAPTTGRLILPYGLGMPLWNRAMSEVPASAGANNHVFAVGDFSQYARCYVGAMRFGRDYELQSDSHLLAFFQSADAKTIYDSGDTSKPAPFRKLTLAS